MVPMGLCTSSSWRQQGKQQPWHLRGLLRWMTSWPCMSVMFMSKGLAGPQHCLVRQSVSS